MPTKALRKLSTNEAAKFASSALDLSDLKRLAAALAEAAAEEVIRNRTFAERVRTLYSEIPEGRAAKMAQDEEPLVPIRQGEWKPINPGAPLDPYFLLNLYGSHQLERALSRYTLVKLKEASAAVEARNPGTKPANRGQKAAIIAYIVEKLAAQPEE